MALIPPKNPLPPIDIAESLGIDSQEPSFGPGDTSDSANDVPLEYHGRDSDSHGTGSRAGADPLESEAQPADNDFNQLVDADDAGVSYSAPDAERNGG